MSVKKKAIAGVIIGIIVCIILDIVMISQYSGMGEPMEFRNIAIISIAMIIGEPCLALAVLLAWGPV